MHNSPRRTALLACVSALAICATGAASARAQDRVYPAANAALTADENIGGSLIIGQGGAANVSIEGAVIDVDNLVLIGDQSGDEGYLIVQLGGQLNAPVGEISLGRSGGLGYLQILTGADVTTLTTMIGGLGTGSLTVDGAGSTLTTDYIRAGTSFGEGYLTISGGGLVTSANNALLGELSGAYGSAIVTGASSRWNHQDQLFIGYRGVGDLQIADGGVVESATGRIGEFADSAGAVTVAGAGSQWAIVTDLFVGMEGDGALHVADGGSVTGQNANLGFIAGSTGSATVTGSGSSWALSGSLIVGYQGSGALIVTDNGVVDLGLGLVAVAYDAGSSGVVSIGGAADGAAAGAGTLEAGEVRFGAGSASLVFNHTETDYVFAPLITGSGRVSHLAGTTILTADNAWTGPTYVHGGTLVIEGASNQGAGAFQVGQVSGDDGALILRGGGTIDSGNVTLGFEAGSVGEATVTGIGSAWDAGGSNFRVGDEGDGILTISGGGSVSSFYGSVGLRAGSTGDATVTGPGSIWAVTSEFGVGSAGHGTLTISDGGAVSAAQGVLGALIGAMGEAAVTGTGSSWTNSGILYVGYQGSGVLEVADAAQVTNTTGYIGHTAGSTGEATVTGVASLWDSSSVLRVGFNGSGSLVIADNATVRVGNGTGVVHVGTGATSEGVFSIGAAAGETAVAAGALEAAEVRFGAGTGALVFNHTETGYEFDALITGAGRISALAGLTTLTNNNTSFTGDTFVAGGHLRIADVLGGDVTVSGGSLGGAGSVLGAVNVGAGSLVGGSGAVLTMGSLVLGADSILNVTLDGPGATALFDVTGDLTLDGTLDITDAGGFGAGIYRLFDYGGALTDNGLEIGDRGGAASAALSVQTADAGQVNLVYSDDLLFWDGAGPADDGMIQGGAGVWSAISTNWTDLNGDTNGAMSPQPGFAVFLGTGGTVTVDGADGMVTITGAQFAVDGYTLTGDGVELEAPGAGQPVILRVGDGTAAGAAITAEIGVDLSGVAAVTKTDLGELILGGINSWTGDTTVHDGRLILRGGSIINGSDLFVVGSSDVAEMLVDGAGFVSLGNVEVGGAGGGGLTVSGAGSRLQASGDVANSGAGPASIAVQAGASLHADGMIQLDSAAMASMIVSGAGSRVTGGSALSLGFAETGVLLVDDDGSVESVSGFLGLLTGAYGQATLMTGGRWSAEEVFVGYEGEGHLQALDGGSLQIAVGVAGGAGSLELGSVLNGYGVLEVEGGLASIENTLWVGRAGDGIVDLGEDGVIQSGSTVIAEGAASISQATVNGGQWTNTGAFVVGQEGWGSLYAEATGSLTTGNAVLGQDIDSLGMAVITDAATSWVINGGLTIGEEGEGALQVRDGAVVSGGVGRAGVGAVGSAEIWVTEDGVLNLDSLTLGEEGEGYLTLTDGGSLSLNGGTGVLTLASDAAGYGVLTIGGVGCGCVPGAPDVTGVLNAAEIVFGPGKGELYFNHTDTDYALSAELTGAGMVSALAGTTRLTGDSADFTGQMFVSGPDARLLVDGEVGGDLLNSVTVVADGGRLGGSGTLDHYVAVDVGGVLEGRSGQTLTLGNLMLAAGAIVEASLGAPSADVLFDVTGDLTLDGELHVMDLGGFGAGLYGLFGYGGTLVDDGLDITSAPGGVNLSDLSLQITGDRVNLINVAGQTLTFWDGAGPANDGVVSGGDGVWTSAGGNWTNAAGTVNGVMDPMPGFAVFSGSAGTATADDVDGALAVTGMQFAVDGYSVVGDAIELAPTGGDPAIIRVGDGTAAGAAMTAMIDVDLTGTALLRKTDLGTLVLTGNAAHTGGTEIAQGGLRVGDGGTTGSLTGDVANEGVLTFDRSDEISFGGVISGTGDLVQAGAGVLRLTAANTHTGATHVLAGTLDVSSAYGRLNGQTALTVAAGATFELGGTFQDVGSFAGAGVISGAGGTLSAGLDDRSTTFSGSLLVSTVNLSGAGTLTVSGFHALETLRIANIVRIGAGGWSDLTGTDGPVVQMSGGLLDLGGNALLIETLEDLALPGAVSLGDGGVLTLSDGRTQFRGVITGSGEFVKDGAYDFTLAGDVAYDGDLTILNGAVVLTSTATLTGDLGLSLASGARFDLNDTDQRLTGLSGSGRVDLGMGSLELAVGNATFAGAFAGTGDITVSGGALGLDGDSSTFDGTVTVEDGARLTGSGVVGGLTTIADGGMLWGVQGRTLALGALVLSEGATVAVALGAAGDTALFDVAGDLTLDGELHVTDVGGFGAGVYRLFDYGGDITDNGLDIASTPAGVSVDDLFVQTSVANQVNLVSTFDVELRFWDTAASTDDGVIQGGAGTWTATGRGWTGADGAVNGAYDNPAFAVFMGTGGTVTVDGAGIGVTGMQFAVDGYQITGDGIALTEDETIVRVGDGTTAGAE
ncbi:autotransporter-associated beta strand repeat-containing protein, partial [Phenylobacterium sp.]|uniref:autotransporter-associated beta strand repeat-containing protein n=1 Tax=Phenylobacterium sp. TaxID=1871053 RepID=UPI003001B1E8